MNEQAICPENASDFVAGSASHHRAKTGRPSAVTTLLPGLCDARGRGSTSPACSSRARASSIVCVSRISASLQCTPRPHSPIDPRIEVLALICLQRVPRHPDQEVIPPNRPQPPRNVRRHMVRWKPPCAIQPSCGTSPASSVGGYLTGSVLSLEVSHPHYHPAVTLYLTLRTRRSDKQVCSALCSRTIIILTRSRSPEGPKTGEHDDPWREAVLRSGAHGRPYGKLAGRLARGRTVRHRLSDARQRCALRNFREVSSSPAVRRLRVARVRARLALSAHLSPAQVHWFRPQ